MNITRKAAAAFAAAAVLGTTACSAAGGAEDGTVPVAIGYQSKTINTVTAGTLMRELGLLDEHLAAAAEETGKTYDLTWHDFASGPPLTAEMIAGKVHIGSMGDYPLSVNGAKTAELGDVKTDWVSVTGYNLRGSLNQIVVPTSSDAKTLADLEGGIISTSLGSTAHGNLVSALDADGMSPEDVEILGQDPPVGVTALESEQVAALAQFVPFPQRVIFSGEGRLLHDGDTGVPTFHGVVASEAYTEEHPEVLQAFLAAQKEATEYLYEHPLEAAMTVAEATGLPPEVVYLYNGPGGAVTFDLTIKDELVGAVETGLPFLEELGALETLDLGDFVDEEPLEELYGSEYDALKTSLTNPSAITGHDEVCDADVADPATASEAWPAEADATEVAATPTCLLRLVAEGGQYRALYVPDAASGTRIFGDYATWVHDPDGEDTMTLLPFATVADAEAYAAEHTGSEVIDYQAALDRV
ncbi:ABC transporter substrate-binding protein [Glycomyces sp. L485]|uniref:ABC transporter substrate-binding protein n=1 Tax=Glycomyces sp. L485 TaxID=2909235 RepID=UPI001F4AC5C0|nr:ABC transporter substrate-binding protein [Glycomyces sp. L485]MCH7230555.1 ABC transporter substrate-binding protein [Glycomyces sp. L485]